VLEATPFTEHAKTLPNGTAAAIQAVLSRLLGAVFVRYILRVQPYAAGHITRVQYE
jgi:hypothetical protein